MSLFCIKNLNNATSVTSPKLNLHGAGRGMVQQLRETKEMTTDNLLNSFKSAGIAFAYSGSAMYPQIPSVKDVLYVLRIEEKPDVYQSALGNHYDYVSNVALVVSAVAFNVLDDMLDTMTREMVVALAIIDLCPDEARCLSNPRYADVFRIVNQDPSLEPALAPDATREILQGFCTCPAHGKAGAAQGGGSVADQHRGWSAS